MHQNESYVVVTTLQEERAELLALKETLQKYIRQLEQSNDDLERGKRGGGGGMVKGGWGGDV